MEWLTCNIVSRSGAGEAIIEDRGMRMADISDRPTLDLPGEGRQQREAGPARPAPGQAPPPVPGGIPWPGQGTSAAAPRTAMIRGAEEGAAPPTDVYNQPTLLLEGDSDERVLAWLVEIGTVQHGQLHPLYRAGTRIGRGRGNHIVFPDERMSREHAFIEVEGGGDGPLRCWLVDMESGHGTFVNDERLSDRRLLQNNDRLRLGETELVFKQLPSAQREA